MQKRNAILLLAIIIAAGVSLRSYQLTARSLWFDESFSWRLIQFPWGELVSRTAADVHPPLYYLLLKSWSRVFGASLFALRFLSVALAGLSIVIIYFFTAEAASRRAGLIAAALLALSAWQIPYAWEARMYMLGAALALLSSWLLLKAALTNSARFWTGYIVCAAAFLYTHNFAAFTLLAHGIFLLVSALSRKKISWLPLVSLSAVFVLYLPWLPVLLHQMKQVQGNYWVPPLTRWSLPDTLYHFIIPTVHALPHSGPTVMLALLPSLAVAIISLWLAWFHRRRPGALLALLCFIVPIAAAISLSLVSQSVYQERFLVFAQVWLWVILAMAVVNLRPPKLAFFISMGIMIALGAAAISYWRELDIKHHPGLAAAVSELNQARYPGEPVFVTSSFIFLPVLFYDGDEMGSPSAPKLVSDSQALAHFAGGPVILPSEIVSHRELIAAPSLSLWVVDTTGFFGHITDVSSPWKLTSRQTFPEVFSYQGSIIVSRWVRPH